jgi:TonB family protein
LRHIVWTAAFGICALTPLLFPWGPKAAKPWPSILSTQTSFVTIAAESEASPRAETAQRPPQAIPVAPALFILWAAGALGVSIRIVRAALWTRTLRHTTMPLDGAAVAASAHFPPTALEGVQIAESDAVAVAVTMGIRAPIIVLPSHYKTWSASRLRSVLRHELAHVHRRDCLIQWLPHVMCILHWFNPLIWLARSQMLCEGERACDDAVLRGGATGVEFARDLLEIAQIAGLKGANPMLTTVVTKIERRVTRLLDPSTNRASLSRAGMLAAAACAVAVLLPIAGVRAQNAASNTAGAQTGTLSGVVSDPTGAVIVGARVQIAGPTGSWTVASNPAGAWSASVPAGSYRIDVLAPGFTSRPTTVNVEPGAAIGLKNRMEIGQLAESIVVTASGTPHAASAVAAAPPQRIRVGGNIQAAKLINKTPPVYPESLRQQGVEGTVLIQAIVGKSGNVMSAQAVGSQRAGAGGAPTVEQSSEFSDAALNAVRTWQYEPTLLNGEPVEVLTTIAISFQLR